MRSRFEVSPSAATALARWVLVIVLGWIGVMRFTADGASSLAQILTQHVVFGRLFGEGAALIAARAIGVIQLGSAVSLAVGLRYKRLSSLGAASALVLTAVPITLLLTNPVWISSLGGFPAIGSGQGIIKYPALAGVALYLWSRETGTTSQLRNSLSLMVAGVMLPLIWIGGMKFTAVEAAGIEPLLSTSPFMSWMLDLFGSRTASNIIGISELLTAALLASWWYRRPLYPLAATCAGITFLATLSFLFTLPGWHAQIGFPALGGSGIFLIKDLGLLAAVIIPLSGVHERENASAVA